jgi:hypothetical protein
VVQRIEDMKMFSTHRRMSALALLAGALLASTSAPRALANEKPFAFVYEASVQPEGEAEYEQWVTWKSHKDSDHSYSRFEFKHEFEFGITDNLQLGIYAAGWSFEDSNERNNHTRFDYAAAEAIYQLINPYTEDFGLALSGEFKGGPELFELENTVILQKNIDNLVLAYNATVEFEWEGDGYSKHNMKLEQSAGVSYQVLPELLLGAELVHDVEYESYARWSPHTVYVGPNVSYRAKGWWVTAAQLFQVTNTHEEANFQTRLVVGVDF